MSQEFNNVARHDKTPVKSTRVGVTLCCDFYTVRSCNTCTFSLPTFAVLQHTTLFLVSSGIL